jgi:cell division protein FtsB
MDVAFEIKKRLRAIVWPLAFACLAIYFGVHLVRNDNGLMALQAYDQRLASADAELQHLTAERVTLERETAWLRPGWTLPDSLGEQARQRLGMGRPDEVMILGH